MWRGNRRIFITISLSINKTQQDTDYIDFWVDSLGYIDEIGFEFIGSGSQTELIEAINSEES